MNKDHACSTLQRFLCVVIIGAVLAFAKADAQESTSIKNKTSHLQAQFNVVDIQIAQYLELEITTSDSDKVSLVTSQNGEYKNAVVLSSQIINDSLLITDPFNPAFSFPQDKLSAHKIIDGKARLSLPRNKHLVINTQSADITITGTFKSLYINQLSGSCNIDQLKGDLTYVSVYANLSVDLKNYNIQAVSRSGNVVNFEKPSSIDYFARLESISGNISNLKKRNK
jgi:hypothetical protein